MKLKYNLLKSKIDYVQANLIKNDFIKLIMRYKNSISINNSETTKINKNIEKIPYNLTYEQLTNILNNNPILKNTYSSFFSKFMSTTILTYLINETNIVDKYLIQLNNNKINLRIISKKKYPLKKVYIKGLKTLLLLEYLGLKNISLNINFSPLPIKKTFNKNLELEPHNFNSGFTTVYYNLDMYGDINIFREEDSDKVFLHELIHCIKYDFGSSYDGGSNDTNLEQNIINTTKVDSNITLFESFTDVYAILINCIIDSILTGSNLNDLIYTETIYLSQLVDYLLKETKIKSIQSLLLPKENNSPIWKQKTPVFSYYILKLGGLIDLDNLLVEYKLSNIKWSIVKQKKYYIFLINNLRNKIQTIKNKEKILITVPSVRMMYNELIL
jgi:hypothetical protein